MAEAGAREAQGHGRVVALTFDGAPIEAREGESVAAALWAAGIRALRRSTARGEPRGIYCNMGVCFECLVWIDGRAVRACVTPVRDGLVVASAE